MANKTHFFSHDSNARNDNKMIAVRMRHKSAGYAVYFMIIERLRDEADYMSIKDYNVLAFDFRESAELVKSVVEDFGLFEFTEDGKKFYSLSFMERMEQMRLFSESGKKGGGNPNFKKGKSNPYYQKDKGIDKPPLSSEINKENKLKETKKNINKELGEKHEDIQKKLDAAIAAAAKRKIEFYNSLVPYLAAHDKEMIKSFYTYWSEFNKSQTRMKWELEKTWETNLRLQTWARREKSKPKQNGYKNLSFQQDLSNQDYSKIV